MKKIILQENIWLKVLILVVLSVGIVSFGQTTYADSSCAGSTMTASEADSFLASGVISADVNISGSQASAEFVNNSNCSMPVSLKAYKMYDQNVYHQKLFSTNSGQVQAHSSLTLSLSIPSCMAQVDAYYGTVTGDPTEWAPNARLLAYDFSQNSGHGYADAAGNFCVDTTPLQISCSANPNNVSVNGTVTWNATVISGGNGNFTYAWSGDDGLSGYSQSLNKLYSSVGTKHATVTVSSNGSNATASCSANVSNTNSGLSVACEVDDSSVDVDEDVRYTANVTGGSGTYVYNWSGSDGLFSTSRSFNWSYDDNGTKHATITVFSGGESASDECSVKVKDNNNDDLSVYCYASDDNISVGNQVRWYAEVDGDDGDIDYDWSGDDGLNSSNRSPSMYYNTPGTKDATVRVRSNGQSDTAHCSINVTQNSVLAFSQSNPNNLVLDSVYLNEVPYTGLADNLNLIWFILGLALFSAYVAYVVIAYKKQHGTHK